MLFSFLIPDFRLKQREREEKKKLLPGPTSDGPVAQAKVYVQRQQSRSKTCAGTEWFKNQTDVTFSVFSLS